MFNKLRAALIAAALAITSIGVTAQPVAAANNGLCAANQWPANQTGQWYYSHTVAIGGSLDEIDGYLTDRVLYPCEGLASQGWSFAAAANVQGDSGGIWQLGILQEGGNAGDQNYFVYTNLNGSGAYVKITSPRPTFGNRYRFRVYKTTAVPAGYVGYQIYTSGGSLLWSLQSFTVVWPQSRFAWWGYETGNSRSLAGIAPNTPVADLVGLYSLTGVSTLVTKTNISSTCFSPSGGPSCATRATRVVTGGSNEIFNVFGQTTG